MTVLSCVVSSGISKCRYRPSREDLRIFKLRIYNSEKEICEVFFDKEYHSLIALESYGHDIEASWLISRACEVLDDKAYYEEMLPVIEGLAKGAYDNGIDMQNHAMNNEWIANYVCQ